MSHDLPLLQRFRQLNGLQKRLAKLCAENANDDTIFRAIGCNREQLQKFMLEIKQELELPTMASEYALRQKIGSVQKQYELWQEELALGAPKESLPMSSNQRDSSESDELEESEDTSAGASQQVEVVQAKPAALPPAITARPQLKAPDIESVAHKIGSLKERSKTTIAFVLRGQRGEMEQVASQLGIGVGALTVRMGKIYKALGLTHVGLTEKRNLLRLAWNKYNGVSVSASAKPVEPVVAPSPIEQSSIPAESTIVELVPPAHDALLEAPAPKADEPSAARASANFGNGVVIPLPKDVINIDIVSGAFNGGEPSSAMANAVRKRKEKGLKPTYLVLSPSSIDPGVTLAQVVFLEREE